MKKSTKNKIAVDVDFMSYNKVSSTRALSLIDCLNAIVVPRTEVVKCDRHMFWEFSKKGYSCKYNISFYSTGEVIVTRCKIKQFDPYQLKLKGVKTK